MLQFIGCGLILLGLAASKQAVFSGVVGLFRLPDFYSKLHALGVIECCGIPLSLTGLASLQENFTCSFKLIIASILILLLSPLSTNLLGKAALLQNPLFLAKIKKQKKQNHKDV